MGWISVDHGDGLGHRHVEVRDHDRDEGHDDGAEVVAVHGHEHTRSWVRTLHFLQNKHGASRRGNHSSVYPNVLRGQEVRVSR